MREHYPWLWPLMIVFPSTAAPKWATQRDGASKYIVYRDGLGRGFRLGEGRCDLLRAPESRSGKR